MERKNRKERQKDERKKIEVIEGWDKGRNQGKIDFIRYIYNK